jgi:nitric oxide synthase oxygenase domain/subunit
MEALAVERVETKEPSIRRIIATLDLTKKCEATLDYAAKLARWNQASRCVAFLFWPSEIAEAICFLISNSEVSGRLWADAGWRPLF